MPRSTHSSPIDAAPRIRTHLLPGRAMWMWRGGVGGDKDLSLTRTVFCQLTGPLRRRMKSRQTRTHTLTPTPKHTPKYTLATSRSLSPSQFPQHAQRAAAAVTEPLLLSGGEHVLKNIKTMIVATCGVCAHATHPECCLVHNAGCLVHNAETCAEEEFSVPQNGGAEHAVPQAP